MFMTAIPVGDLLPGDIITTDTDDIQIDSLSEVATGVDTPPLVRIHGYIVRGYSRSRTNLRTWTRNADETVDIERTAP